MSKHTPTPWHLEEIVEGVEELKGMRSICGPDSDAPSVSDYIDLADAELIVRAVNAHEQLVKALKTANIAFHEGEIGAAWSVVRKALRAVEGEP